MVEELIEPDKDYHLYPTEPSLNTTALKNVIEEGPTRAIAKWGSQDKQIHLYQLGVAIERWLPWSKQVLNDYQLVDTLGPNQNSLRLHYS